MNQAPPGNRIALPLLLAAAAFVLASCASTPAPPTRGKVVPWKLQITKTTPATIQVDLIGVSKNEDAYWRRGIKPDDYWNPNKSVRKEAQGRRVSVNFETNSVFVLPADSPVWNKWFKYGSYELLIIADLPGNHSNDEFDPRRQFIPLGKKEWQGKTIEVEISDNQIRVVTPPRP